jgi:hypothetical protein
VEYGGPSERQLVITEMLGQTEENEPLQAMMKDQFANYVVQKVRRLFGESVSRGLRSGFCRSVFISTHLWWILRFGVSLWGCLL